MATWQGPAGRDRLVPVSKVGEGGQLHPILSPHLRAWALVIWSVPPTHDSARTSGLKATLPRQGVLEGRVVHSETQSHWFPNGNKIL